MGISQLFSNNHVNSYNNTHPKKLFKDQKHTEDATRKISSNLLSKGREDQLLFLNGQMYRQIVLLKVWSFFFKWNSTPQQHSCFCPATFMFLFNIHTSTYWSLGTTLPKHRHEFVPLLCGDSLKLFSVTSVCMLVGFLLKFPLYRCPFDNIGSLGYNVADKLPSYTAHLFNGWILTLK